MHIGTAIRNRGLSLVTFTLFLVCLVAQSVAGLRTYNQEQLDHNDDPVAYAAYFREGHFYQATFENWESEFLQMALYVILTAFLYQKGSAESNDPDSPGEASVDPARHRADPNAPWPVRRGGIVLALYRHSLSIALTVLFIASFAGHAVGGLAEYNSERALHGDPAVDLAGYVGSSRFWFESFQNWQSEFLAVWSIVVLSIWLRQQGSAESKPVAAPHSQTGTG
jgi:hypothetical protein